MQVIRLLLRACLPAVVKRRELPRPARARRGMFVLSLCACAAPFAAAADFDLLIRNARVIDGAGNPWYRADIGVKAGLVSALGDLKVKTADRTIDAAGRVAAPGFIDVHTHIEGGIEAVPSAENYIRDGVTTVVTGNCGGSEYPLAKWFEKLEKTGLGLNVASLIGHNTIRRQVMGTANRLATAEELEKMQALVEAQMNQGAVGFSTGLIYIPGAYSNQDEVVALAKPAGKHGGVYASHMRDEGAHITGAINEAVTAGREAGARVQLSHFKIDNKNLWGHSVDSIALIEKYRGEGVDVVVDQYPYDHSSTNLGITLPSWALADGAAAVKERLASAETRARIAKEMEASLRARGHENFSYATVATYRPERTYEGKTISEINRMMGRDANVAAEIETIFDLTLKGGARMVYHSMGGDDVDRIMRYANTAIASDGGVREFGVGMPHPRSYGTNARVLAEYVRNRKVLTLEDAIRRMTSLPARTFAFKDRGLLREGMAADIVIFDPARVTDKATYQKPHQYTEGFDFVIVNGKAVIDGAVLTADRPGRVLRHTESK